MPANIDLVAAAATAGAAAMSQAGHGEAGIALSARAPQPSEEAAG